MNEMKITEANIKNAELLRTLAEETFNETYAGLNSEADMQRYISTNFNVDQVQEELSTVDSHFFIVWDRDEAIGYIKLNTGAAQTELQDPLALEIERIYVKAQYHGKKIGQLLYEKAVAFAQELHKNTIWLGVWEHNPKAIRFYEKNGFVTFDTHLFTLGTEEQTDLMMRKTLG
jgi:ribosomal protein S18 acetylase RimI-like enzyme